jgi:hypothetical protein
MRRVDRRPFLPGSDHNRILVVIRGASRDVVAGMQP